MGCIDSSIGMVMAVWVKKMSAYASSSVVCDQPERFFLHVRVPVKITLGYRILKNGRYQVV